MSVPDRKSAIILNIDGLRPSMLGPYGNTWFDTPGFNRLAAESIVYQQCIAEIPDHAVAYQSLLTGQHPAELIHGWQRNAAPLWPDFPDDTIFLTDRPVPSGARIESAFDRVIQIGSSNSVTALAESVEQATIARFFAESIDWIQNQPETSLFWLDCQGMFGSWDAPYPFRAQSVDSDDPDAPTFHTPPSTSFNAQTDDPDQLLGYQQAYAGQVMLLDQCLTILMEELESSGRLEQTLFCLYSSSGYPLGEHGVVGDFLPSLHSESIHLPLMIRWPTVEWSAIRNHHLVHPGVILDALNLWFGGDNGQNGLQPSFGFPPEGMPEKPLEAVFSVCQAANRPLEALQTHAWKLMRGDGNHLYVQPDDIWEVNDLYGHCMDVAQSMESQLTAGKERLQQGFPLLGEPLADDLAFGIE